MIVVASEGEKEKWVWRGVKRIFHYIIYYAKWGWYIKLYTWDLYNCINQCHPRKFNKKWGQDININLRIPLILGIKKSWFLYLKCV